VIAVPPESRFSPPDQGLSTIPTDLSTDTFGIDRGNGVSGERPPTEREPMNPDDYDPDYEGRPFPLADDEWGWDNPLADED
jgi:hypothetical protein